MAWMLKITEDVEALKAAIGANSSNSSKPPSQDPFRNAAKKKRRRRQRQRHHSGGRKLLAASEVDEFRDVYPERCKGCGLPLTSESQLMGRAGPVAAGGGSGARGDGDGVAHARVQMRRLWRDDAGASARWGGRVVRAEVAVDDRDAGRRQAPNEPSARGACSVIVTA